VGTDLNNLLLSSFGLDPKKILFSISKPHPVISFSLPLGSGVTEVRELTYGVFTGSKDLVGSGGLKGRCLPQLYMQKLHHMQ
jgi:hypothetical protein